MKLSKYKATTTKQDAKRQAKVRELQSAQAVSKLTQKYGQAAKTWR